MKKVVLLLAVCLFAIVVVGCSDSSELEHLRQTNGTGSAEYYGPWVSVFKNYLFWPYAIIFGILFLGRDWLVWGCHFVITIAFFISFHWDLDPLRTLLIPYYICMPMLFIPPIKNDWIFKILLVGCLAAFAFLFYKAWCYEGFFTWLFHMVVWGVCGYGGAIVFYMQLEGRCPHCGYYALSWRGRTKRYAEAVNHFRYLNANGSDMDNLVEDEEVNHEKKRCGHCLHLNDE